MKRQPTKFSRTVGPRAALIGALLVATARGQHTTEVSAETGHGTVSLHIQHGLPGSPSDPVNSILVYVPMRMPEGYAVWALTDNNEVLLSREVETESFPYFTEQFYWWRAGELAPILLPGGWAYDGDFDTISGVVNGDGDLLVDVIFSNPGGDVLRSALLKRDGMYTLLDWVGVAENFATGISRNYAIGSATTKWAGLVDGDGAGQLISGEGGYFRWSLPHGPVVELASGPTQYEVPGYPAAVNDDGDILWGWYEPSPGRSGLYFNSTLIDGSWGLDWMLADTAALNNLGHVAGSTFELPFFWDGVYQPLGNDTGTVADMNDTDTVLVNQRDGTTVLWRPFTGSDGNRGFAKTSLADLCPTFTAEAGYFINNAETILAYGTAQGEPPGTYLLVATTAALVVDANRDGVLGLRSEPAPDLTSPSTPFRFWINDDDDQGPADGDDIPGRPLNKADYNNAVVDSVRDLVDFFPLFLDIKQLLGVLPHTTAGITYKLKQADGALNFVYTNKTRTQAFDYQKQILATGFGPAFTQAAGAATTQHITAAGATLNNAFLDHIKNNNGGVILIEGRVATTAPLRLVVEKDGTEIAEVAVNIKISPVEEMFRHVDLTGVPKNYDNTNPSLPETPEATRVSAPANWPDTQTNGKYFVFLHGYNVDAQKARGWQAEVFKRLHVLGSKARFVGVTWHGATGLDYHRAVFHAFQTGDALAGALSFTGSADVTIAAHSLGNMVVSHAIQSGGLVPARYYIINGATPLEAYGPNDASPGEAAHMTELAWRTYDSRLYMANWHTLFPGTDNRSALTWKNLFASVRTRATTHNFYSEEEEVVADADENTSASIVATLLNQGFNVTFGAWKAQELVKGVDWITSLVSAFMIRGQAGWGFNTDWNILDDPLGPPGQGGTPISRRRTPAQTTSITDEELKTKPFFEEFLEAELMSANAATASAKAGEAWVRYDLFARGIPAMSNATAANVMASLTNARNFPMHTAGKVAANGHFPTNARGDWRHSDFKDVGLPYVYPMYQAMIDRGGLDQ